MPSNVDPADGTGRERSPPGTHAVGWSDLTAFQRDVLFAIADLGDGHPYGRQIKSRLDREYGEDVVQSRLYQALDSLVDAGLVTKRQGTIDARTKYYALTDAATRLIRAHAHWCASAAGFDVVAREPAEP